MASHSQQVANQADPVGFVIYSDFNCPFSYALNERIIALGLESCVSFRDVQREPQTSSQQFGFGLLSMLSAEVAEVGRRAPSVDINIPMFRPNSAVAISLVHRVSREDSQQGQRLRHAVFRALWVEGKDISDRLVLDALLEKLGIEVLPETDADRDQLAKWQLAWADNAEFEQKLPVVVSAQGETVVGFPLEPEVDGFLKTGSLVSDQTLYGATGQKQKQWILVLDNDLPGLQMIIQQLRSAQVEIVQDVAAMASLIKAQGVPDLVIVNMGLIDYRQSDDWWRSSMGLDMENSVPVIFTSEENSIEAEVAAFEAGAVEFIAKPYHPRVLEARLKMQLKVRSYQQELSNIARIDALTSICNRREFDLQLLSEWRRGARSGSTLALLMIDIDKFKEYNDSYGHLRGDDCLTLVAQTLKSCMQRSTDTLARYGGEEFVALLPESDIKAATELARQCKRAIEKAAIPHIGSPLNPCLTVSIGVATTKPAQGERMTLLVERADVALYQAKKNGRNRICVFEDDG